jgi:hypothetical protein
MGLRERGQQAVGDHAHTLAAEAHREGLSFYTPTLDKPSGIAGGLGVAVWALELDAIEAAGWNLEQWQVDGGRAYPVFRRVVDSSLTNQ